MKYILNKPFLNTFESTFKSLICTSMAMNLPRKLKSLTFLDIIEMIDAVGMQYIEAQLLFIYFLPWKSTHK